MLLAARRSEIVAEAVKIADEQLALFLVKSVQRQFLGLADCLLNAGNSAPARFSQENMRLPGILDRIGFGEEPLRLQARNGFGDGGRPDADLRRQRARRLAVQPRQRQHQLILARIQIFLEQPCGEHGSRQPRRMIELLHDLPVFLRHDSDLLTSWLALLVCRNQAKYAGK